MSFEYCWKLSLKKSRMHTFHTLQLELIFLDCQKMQNTVRDFILEMDFCGCKTLEMEMDFSEHRTLQLEWVQMDFSMAFPRTSVEWVKEVVITATQMMSQRSIAICLMTIDFVEVSLHVQVQDHILLTQGIQSLSQTVLIIECASHLH
jgi:hypothetical protein